MTAVRIIMRPVWSSLDSESEIIKSYWGTLEDTAEIMTDKDKVTPPPLSYAAMNILAKAKLRRWPSLESRNVISEEN